MDSSAAIQGVDGAAQAGPGLVRIPARSERQAMDWSLVLASQGIEAVILPPDEAGGWGLLIEPRQAEGARRSIQQYRLENRGWSWRKELPGANLEIHAGALVWCLLLAAAHWAATFLAPELLAAGRMDSAAVGRGEWHRLFTAVMLHADLPHLMANAAFGSLILGLAMARFGAGVALLATFLAGALGNAAGFWLHDRPYLGVGASGMMMGALGMLCAHSAGLWRQSPKAGRYVLSGVIAGFLLFVLFGLSPNSDLVAHLGGFVSGGLLGLGLALADEKALCGKKLNAGAAGVLAALIAVAWGRAMW